MPPGRSASASRASPSACGSEASRSETREHLPHLFQVPRHVELAPHGAPDDALLVDDVGHAGGDAEKAPQAGKDAVALADGARDVGKEQVRNAVLFGELGVAVFVVGGDAEDFGIEAGELRMRVAEGADLTRADGGEVARVEEEDDVLATAEVGEANAAAVVARGLEVGSGRAGAAWPRSRERACRGGACRQASKRRGRGSRCRKVRGERDKGLTTGSGRT